MLKRAVEKDVFEGTLRIRVLMPEDIVGLKLQAFTNDPSRRSGDLADIEALLSVRRNHVDWDLVAQYFNLFEMETLLKEMMKKIDEQTQPGRNE